MKLSVPEQPFRMLVIDDDEIYVELLGAVFDFADEGVVVDAEYALAGGLERLSRPEDFDCVLLDLSLPDVAGLEGVEKVVAAAGAVPVFVLTGRDDADRALGARRLGARYYLVKGGEADGRLWQAIRSALEPARPPSCCRRVPPATPRPSRRRSVT